MRSGACTLQQTLTAEAASVLKHSLGLARRRGHAQVTPLHVAATLLSLRASPLRRACLQSQQLQPQSLHSRALELCFNVALNRLPTTPGPLLHSQPSLSNALIAALKRAQAHQRRGCIEQQQQQPLLTIKVELDQLIISILDDPSVSRVMREAGFSSTLVKTNIEDSSSSSSSLSLGASSVFQSYNSSGGGVFSSPSSPSPSPTDNHRETIINTTTSLRNAHFLASYYASEYPPAPVLFSPQKKASSVYPFIPYESGDSSSSSSSKDGDIKVVMDVLMRKKKRNTVIVGDSVSLTEGLVGELMGKIERGDVPDELKSIHFIKFQFSPLSLRLMKRDEVEMNLSALKRKVESVASEGGRGAIFYVGDLKWTVVEGSESRDDDDGGGELVSGYSPIQHLVAEMGKMFGENGNYCNNNNKVWLMGTASYQTYIKCQMRQPSLETLWALQPVPVPSGGLGLTLHASSVYDSKMSMSQNPSHILDTRLLKEEHDKLNCCEECASNYEKEVQLFKPGGQKKLLPSWLQSSTEAHQKDELAQLKRKWNRLCQFLHQSKEPQNQNHLMNTSQYTSNAKIYPYNSSYPWWPNQSNVLFPDSSSISFADSAAIKAAHSSILVPRFRRQQSCTIEFNFSEVTAQKKQGTAATSNLDCLKGMEGNKEVKISLALGNSTFFGGSGQTVENITDTTMQRAHVCKMLQENVPWQSETLPSIAEALVDSKLEKQWVLLQGNDSVGKTRLALAIAESVFGSVDSLLHLDMKKLENSATPFCEIVAGSLKRSEKIVVLVEDVDFAEPQFKKLLADEFEASKFGHLSIKDGNNNSGQAIFILTTSGGTRSNEEQNNNDSSVMRLVLKVSENKANFEKRRAELDLFGKIKIPRIEENEEEIVFVSEEWSNKKKDFSRQSSFNTLDLNLKADEEEEEKEYDDDDDDHDGGENSPISSDLTGEPIADTMNSNGFLDSIENRFEFNISPARDKEKEEMFFSKIKGSFEEVICGKRTKNHVNFSVDERVIEEIGVGCGSFTNSMFEKWLKDIFQSSLLQQQKVNKYGDGDYGREGIVFITLCWGGGKGDHRIMDSGFMGSCLPNNVQVNYFIQ